MFPMPFPKAQMTDAIRLLLPTREKEAEKGLNLLHPQPKDRHRLSAKSVLMDSTQIHMQVETMLEILVMIWSCKKTPMDLRSLRVLTLMMLTLWELNLFTQSFLLEWWIGSVKSRLIGKFKMLCQAALPPTLIWEKPS